MLSGLYITQQALAALTELILILAVVGPLLIMRRRSRASNDFLGAVLSGGFLSLLLLVEALMLGDLPAYAGDIWNLVWAVVFHFLLAFAFSFLPIPTDPIRVSRLHREEIVARAISIGFIVLALLPLVFTLVNRPQPAISEAISRSVTVWSIIAILWGDTVFWRRAAYASMESYPERKLWQQWVWPQGHSSQVAVVLAVIGLLPIPVAVLLARQPVASSTTMTTVLMICMLLIRFAGALVYYNYSEEKISILVKLSVTTLLVVLASISLVGALVEPYYLETFHALNGNLETADFVTAQRSYLHQRLLPLFWLIIGVSAFILLGSPIFFRYILVAPLNGLMTAVRAVDQGDLTARATVYFRDEIGIVTDAFNRMVSSVRQVDERLEAQVVRRTEALAEATAQAEAASKAKSDFLAQMSHELRTPLNGILGYAQILRDDETLSPDQIEGIEVIEASGRHLLALINDILDLSRIEADKLTLDLADFSLPDLLDGVIQMMHYTAEEQGLALEWAPPPELPLRVYGDERRLRQVLINLLGNALKFTKNGHVALLVNRLGTADHERDAVDVGDDNVTRLRFAVQDTGIGLSAEQIEEIFLPFEQAQSGRGSTQGAGLGLPISQRLVQLMGGEIKVESRVGEGSRFWFDIALPCVQEAMAGGAVGVSSLPVRTVKEPASQPANLLLPPLPDRIAIYESARLGDMVQIKIEAERLARDSAIYRPFAEKVLALAAKFNDAAIQALVQPDDDDSPRGSRNDG